MQSIILASQSPRRKQLLEWANIDFEVQVSNTNEDYPNTLSINEIPEIQFPSLTLPAKTHWRSSCFPLKFHMK